MNGTFIIYTILVVVFLTVVYILAYFTKINKKIFSRDWLYMITGAACLILWSFVTVIGSDLNSKLSNQLIEPTTEFITHPKTDSLITDAKLYKYLLKTRVRNPKIIFCQAKHESQAYSSPLYKRAYNLFGMKVTTSRVCVGGEESGEYQSYRGWRESVTDFIIYGYENGLNNLSEKEYFEYLAIGKYAKDPEYVNKLKKMLQSTNFNKLSK